MAREQLIGDRCPRCNGSGSIIVQIFETDCPDCAGTGLINSPNACKECHGSGSKIVEIEAGGTKIRAKARCGHCNGTGLEPL